jgi:hypothetical protein
MLTPTSANMFRWLVSPWGKTTFNILCYQITRNIIDVHASQFSLLSPNYCAIYNKFFGFVFKWITLYYSIFVMIISTSNHVPSSHCTGYCELTLGQEQADWEEWASSWVVWPVTAPHPSGHDSPAAIEPPSTGPEDCSFGDTPTGRCALIENQNRILLFRARDEQTRRIKRACVSFIVSKLPTAVDLQDSGTRNPNSGNHKSFPILNILFRFFKQWMSY